jgi:hypothetical protein
MSCLISGRWSRLSGDFSAQRRTPCMLISSITICGKSAAVLHSSSTFFSTCNAPSPDARNSLLPSQACSRFCRLLLTRRSPKCKASALNALDWASYTANPPADRSMSSSRVVPERGQPSTKTGAVFLPLSVLAFNIPGLKHSGSNITLCAKPPAHWLGQEAPASNCYCR